MVWTKKKRAGGPLDSGRPYTRFDNNSILRGELPQYVMQTLAILVLVRLTVKIAGLHFD